MDETSLQQLALQLESEVAHFKSQLADASTMRNNQMQTSSNSQLDIRNKLLHLNSVLFHDHARTNEIKADVDAELVPHRVLLDKPAQLQHVKQLRDFTGVRFTHIDQRPVVGASSATDNQAPVQMRHFSIKGSCHQSPFTVSFRVAEPALAVQNLAIFVPDELHPAFQSRLRECTASNNLLGSFRMLSQYTRLSQVRRRELATLIDKFPGSRRWSSPPLAKPDSDSRGPVTTMFKADLTVNPKSDSMVEISQTR
ncbi:hypothetical protein H4R33_002675 [Dimargaris cristalligena]|uniref:Uncharacterized protein n=1 Tax=Dimargaris cristalligena TaxID=215637 RepID=A0A4P9ZW30_9FUNG|nr:hypothetical protein H4R33_002675 [Dimargaris cristalligena]RKP37062.1 hypothetical protein BJ085DRAFT_40319 [Dimargaris cristalligena]|eukprot:RKP37062.1 hypothetical protein BJ085DRAFT_40319 [Dimargaris cristalligena]